jgi:hypothetical protein
MCVRSSTASYGGFNLTMGRSPGFGSMICDSCAQLRLGFPSAPHFLCLTLPHIITRRTVLQKVRGYGYKYPLPQFVSTGFQVLFHSPPGVLFTFPSQYWYTIGHWVVFSLGEWSPRLPTRFLVSRGTLDTASIVRISCTGLSPCSASFPKTVPLSLSSITRSETPECKHSGLGSFPFARRYWGNHGCFLFLRLLRCFSSSGSLRTAMYSQHDKYDLHTWVSSFRHLRVTGYVLLTAAFRSLSRLSSALSAKASALRSL